MAVWHRLMLVVLIVAFGGEAAAQTVVATLPAGRARAASP
jgi:hypothetical protein